MSSKSYPGVYKFGGAYNGGKFPDPTGRMSSGNYLIYGMASQAKPFSARMRDRIVEARSHALV